MVKKTIESNIHTLGVCASKNGRRRFLHKIKCSACRSIHMCVGACLALPCICSMWLFHVPTHPAASSTSTYSSNSSTSICYCWSSLCARASHFHRCNICVLVMVHEFGMASNWNERTVFASFNLNRDACIPFGLQQP